MQNDTSRACRNGHDVAKIGTYKIRDTTVCKACHREGIERSRARMRALRDHPLELATEKEHARFWQKVIKGDSCWEWSGAPHPLGYGICTLAGRTLLAHRVSYFNFVGPVDDELEIDHLCSNRACVNPAHLEQVSHQENCMRGVKRRAA